jgi:hypothetical protein
LVLRIVNEVKGTENIYLILFHDVIEVKSVLCLSSHCEFVVGGLNMSLYYTFHVTPPDGA